MLCHAHGTNGFASKLELYHAFFLLYSHPWLDWNHDTLILILFQMTRTLASFSSMMLKIFLLLRWSFSFPSLCHNFWNISSVSYRYKYKCLFPLSTIVLSRLQRSRRGRKNSSPKSRPGVWWFVMLITNLISMFEISVDYVGTDTDRRSRFPGMAWEGWSCSQCLYALVVTTPCRYIISTCRYMEMLTYMEDVQTRSSIFNVPSRIHSEASLPLPTVTFPVPAY